MAEILVKAVDAMHPDPDQDVRGCYKRGMPVAVMPDGHLWGAREGLPRFVIVKVPGISVERVSKYVLPQPDPLFPGRSYRRRRWRIRWEDLPQRAQRLLRDNGELTIAAGGYSGASDYSWSQVRSYFRNLETGADESEDL